MKSMRYRILYQFFIYLNSKKPKNITTVTIKLSISPITILSSITLSMKCVTLSVTQFYQPQIYPYPGVEYA